MPHRFLALVQLTGAFLLSGCVIFRGEIPIEPGTTWQEQNCPSSRILISRLEHDRKSIEYGVAVARERAVRLCMDAYWEVAQHNYNSAKALSERKLTDE